MIPAKTYELRIVFLNEEGDIHSLLLLKESVASWLAANGVESFVEGSIDDIYVDHNYDQTLSESFADMGGRESPISIFDYSLEYLTTLKAKLLAFFPTGIRVEDHSMESQVWMEGWKESFKPISTDRFWIHPPWDVPANIEHKFMIDIEPGMAFGTGQHATTQICMRELEKLHPSRIIKKRCLDVGTGTGVLAIAASKLGFSEVVGTDIDHLAIESANYNCGVNHAKVKVWQGSCPTHYPEGNVFEPADLVIANILPVVLYRILPDLARVTAVGGLLIMSGILVEQLPEMTEACRAHGFVALSESSFEGWGLLLLEKRV